MMAFRSSSQAAAEKDGEEGAEVARRLPHDLPARCPSEEERGCLQRSDERVGGGHQRTAEALRREASQPAAAAPRQQRRMEQRELDQQGGVGAPRPGHGHSTQTLRHAAEEHHHHGHDRDREGAMAERAIGDGDDHRTAVPRARCRRGDGLVPHAPASSASVPGSMRCNSGSRSNHWCFSAPRRCAPTMA